MKDEIKKCPQCGNTENFQMEKSPYGKTKCLQCNHKAEHFLFMADIETEEESKAAEHSDLDIIVEVQVFKPSGKYADTLSLKFSDLNDKIEQYELCWYLIIEQIRIFRQRTATAGLIYSVGYSDESVKNYYKNDIYPILIND